MFQTNKIYRPMNTRDYYRKKNVLKSLPSQWSNFLKLRFLRKWSVYRFYDSSVRVYDFTLRLLIVERNSSVSLQSDDREKSEKGV